MPLMVTGGFRSRAAMEAALAGGHCAVIGIARPLCTDTDIPARLIRGETAEAPRYEQQLKLSRRRLLSGASPIFLFRIINVLGQMGWYYNRLFELADGRPPKRNAGLLGSLFAYLVDEYRTAFRMRRARRHLAKGGVPD